MTSFVQDLQDSKDDFSMVQVGAIVGIGAQTNDCAAVDGSRYQAAAVLTGGLVGDICRTEWNGMMSDLGLNATGIRSQFQLS